MHELKPPLEPQPFVPSPVGAPEMVAGGIAGTLVTALLANVLGKVPGTPDKEAVKKAIIERIAEKTESISTPILEEFRKLKPPPADAKAAKAWSEEAMKYLQDSPVYKAFVEAEEKAVINEMAERTAKAMGKSSATASEIIKAWESGSEHTRPSLLKRPLLAFSSLSTAAKIGVGAVGLATAYGVAKWFNNSRNRTDSHIDALNRDRIQDFQEFKSL